MLFVLCLYHYLCPNIFFFFVYSYSVYRHFSKHLLPLSYDTYLLCLSFIFPISLPSLFYFILFVFIYFFIYLFRYFLVFSSSGTIYVFLVEMEDGIVSSRDRTMTFTTFVMFDMFNSLACRHNNRSVFELNWNSNKAFLLALAFSLIGQLFVLYCPPLQKIFRTVALSFSDLIFVIFLSSSMLVLDTIRKKYFSGIFTEILPHGAFRSDKGKKIEKKEDKNGSFMV